MNFQTAHIIFLICLAATGNLWAVCSEASAPMGEPELSFNKEELAVFRQQLKERYGKTEEKSKTGLDPALQHQIENTFYTGKPYLPTTGTYAFKYRDYNPNLARWTSEDPSGFPDGANNSYYAPTPTSQFDYMGLAVIAQYSITGRTLIIDGVRYENLASGDNQYENRFERGGPIPPGNYEIFSRQQGAKTYGGHEAFILDPIDRNRYNDIWDGTDAHDRSAFRIHLNGLTLGCITSAAIDQIAKQIWDANPNSKVIHDIIQPIGRIGQAETLKDEFLLGMLTVIE